jgi:Protein of unknown function (DUF3592)
LEIEATMNPQLTWALIALTATALAILWIRMRIRLKRAHAWPMSTGKVASTAVRLEGSGTELRYVAEMSYSYMVNGTSYFGHLRRTFMLHGRAHGWASSYSTGRPVIVRYNPANAGDSVLFENEQTRTGAA